jgi:hypothetical protein
MTERDSMRDFRTFFEGEEIPPPEEVSLSILELVQSDLHPSAWKVFWKVAVVHVVVGTATLSVCPQFGFSLGAKRILFDFLMRYGQSFCTAACGAFFLGSSALMVSLVLRSGEIRLLRKYRIFPWVSLGLFSLLVFHLIGGSVMDRVGVIWLAGALIGAKVLSELSWGLRTLLRHRWAY